MFQNLQGFLSARVGGWGKKAVKNQEIDKVCLCVYFLCVLDASRHPVYADNTLTA